MSQELCPIFREVNEPVNVIVDNSESSKDDEELVTVEAPTALIEAVDDQVRSNGHFSCAVYVVVIISEDEHILRCMLSFGPSICLEFSTI